MVAFLNDPHPEIWHKFINMKSMRFKFHIIVKEGLNFQKKIKIKKQVVL